MACVILVIFTVIWTIEFTTSNPTRNEQISGIVGGTIAGWTGSENLMHIANNGKYPYMASFRYNGQHKCGAIIIKPNFVLTAAHCVKDRKHHELMKIKAGTYIKDDFRGKYVQVREVDSFRYHSEFDQNAFTNDIAVLKLKTDFVFSTRVNLINLPKSTENFVGESATVMGFGKIENGEKSKFLRFADVKVISHKKCEKMIALLAKKKSKSERMLMKRTQLCTIGIAGDKGGCSGDSGGPLIKHTNGNSIDDILIGLFVSVVTTGNPPNNCYVSLPTVYTDITVLSVWIEQTIGELLNSLIL